MVAGTICNLHLSYRLTCSIPLLCKRDLHSIPAGLLHSAGLYHRCKICRKLDLESYGFDNGAGDERGMTRGMSDMGSTLGPKPLYIPD